MLASPHEAHLCIDGDREKETSIQLAGLPRTVSLGELDARSLEHIRSALGDDVRDQRRFMVTVDSDTIATSLLGLPQVTAREILEASDHRGTENPELLVRTAYAANRALYRATQARHRGGHLAIRADAADAAALGAFTSPDLDRRTEFFRRYVVINALGSRHRTRMSAQVSLEWLASAPSGPLRSTAIERAFSRRHLPAVLHELRSTIDGLEDTGIHVGRERDRGMSDVARTLLYVRCNGNDGQHTIQRHLIDHILDALPALNSAGHARAAMEMAEQLAGNLLPFYRQDEVVDALTAAVSEPRLEPGARARIFSHLTRNAVRSDELFSPEQADRMVRFVFEHADDARLPVKKRALLLEQAIVLKTSPLLTEADDALLEMFPAFTARCGTGLLGQHEGQLDAARTLSLCEKLLTMRSLGDAPHAFAAEHLDEILRVVVKYIMSAEERDPLEPRSLEDLTSSANELFRAVESASVAATPSQRAALVSVLLASERHEYRTAPARIEARMLLATRELDDPARSALSIAMLHFLGGQAFMIPSREIVPLESEHMLEPFRASIRQESSAVYALLGPWSRHIKSPDLPALARVWRALFQEPAQTAQTRETIDGVLTDLESAKIFEPSPEAHRIIQEIRLNALAQDASTTFDQSPPRAMHRMLSIDCDALARPERTEWAFLALRAAACDARAPRAKSLRDTVRTLLNEKRVNDAGSLVAALNRMSSPTRSN